MTSLCRAGSTEQSNTNSRIREADPPPRACPPPLAPLPDQRVAGSGPPGFRAGTGAPPGEAACDTSRALDALVGCDDGPRWAEPTGRRRRGGVTAFPAPIEPRLRRVLVAACGPYIGRETLADVLEWAWEHLDRVRGLDNPVRLPPAGRPDRRPPADPPCPLRGSVLGGARTRGGRHPQAQRAAHRPPLGSDRSPARRPCARSTATAIASRRRPTSSAAPSRPYATTWPVGWSKLIEELEGNRQ